MTHETTYIPDLAWRHIKTPEATLRATEDRVPCTSSRPADATNGKHENAANPRGKRAAAPMDARARGDPTVGGRRGVRHLHLPAPAKRSTHTVV